jgi:hypothetical protein
VRTCVLRDLSNGSKAHTDDEYLMQLRPACHVQCSMCLLGDWLHVICLQSQDLHDRPAVPCFRGFDDMHLFQYTRPVNA